MIYLRGGKREIDFDPDPELAEKVNKMMDEMDREKKEKESKEDSKDE